MTYDLTTEPWIPVRWTSGGSAEVGLQDALAEAHRIAEVVAPSPLETVALYRLLQALFVRLYVHPEDARDDAGFDEDVWFDLWEAKRFDAESIDAYLDKHREQFDLFHPERPFYGHPDPERPNEGPLAWIAPEWAKGNNETLFNHTLDSANPSLAPAEAARALVAHHAYGLGGLSGGGRPSYREGPLVAGLVFWIRGRSLFEALLLNTPPEDTARMPSPQGDKPAWEQALPGDEDRHEKGYLDYLTWQSRHVRLITEEGEEEDGRLRVTDVHLRSGPKWASKRHDPLMALRVSKKGEHYPFKLQPGVALWRQAPLWLGLELSGERSGFPPRTFQWLASTTAPNGELDQPGEADLAWMVDVLGLSNDQAKMELIRHEQVPVYPAILRDRTLQGKVEDAIGQADRQVGSLRRALRVCAAGLAGDQRTAADVAQALQAEDGFWAKLEAGFLYRHKPEVGFFVWLGDLAEMTEEHGKAKQDSISDERDEALRLHLARWTRTLHRAAMEAYNEATEAFVTTPRRLEAVARGRNALRPATAYAQLLNDAESAHA